MPQRSKQGFDGTDISIPPKIQNRCRETVSPNSRPANTGSRTYAILLAIGAVRFYWMFATANNGFHSWHEEWTHFLDRLRFLISFLRWWELRRYVCVPLGLDALQIFFWRTHKGPLPVQGFPLEPCSLLFSSMYHLFNLSWAFATCK